MQTLDLYLNIMKSTVSRLSDELLRQFNIDLEAEVEVKDGEIEELRRKIDIITLGTRVNSLNNTGACEECKRKEQQIQTLIKAIKTLRRPSPNSKSLKAEKSESSANWARKNSFLQYSCSADEKKDQLSGYLRPDFSENRLKPSQVMQQVCNLQKTLSYLAFSEEKQGGSLRNALQKLEQQVASLRNENKILQIQVELYKEKLHLKQKDQIHKFHYTPREAVITSTHDRSERQTPLFASVRSNITRSNKADPSQRSSKQSDKVHQVSVHSCMQRINQQKCACQRLQSPLQVQLKASRDDRNKLLNRTNRLVEQRSKSLNHKIRVLEHENYKMRAEIGIRNY